MGSFHWLKKEYFKRQYYCILEMRKLVLKSLIACFHFSIESKIYFSIKFNFFSKNSSISFLRNGCFISYLSRSIFSLFKYSRHFSKLFASFGLFCGMRKSSF